MKTPPTCCFLKMLDNISGVVTWRRWFRLLEKLWLFCKHCTLPSCFTVFRVWSISTQRNTLCVCGKAGNMKAAGIVDRKDFAGWSEISEFGPPPWSQSGPPPWSQSTGGVKAKRKCLSISFFAPNLLKATCHSAESSYSATGLNSVGSISRPLRVKLVGLISAGLQHG